MENPNPKVDDGKARKIAALTQHLDELEQRLQYAEDVSAIKKLTHVSGFYLDKGLWADLNDLLTDDAMATQLPESTNEESSRDIFGDELVERSTLPEKNQPQSMNSGQPSSRWIKKLKTQMTTIKYPI